MSNSKIHEMERLVSQMCDEGLSPHETQQLEQLLLDDPKMQARYWQFIGTHAALDATGAPAEVAMELCPSCPIPLEPTVAPSAAAPTPEHGWRIAAAAVFLLGAIVWGAAWWSPHTPFGSQAAAKPQEAGLSLLPVITSVSWKGPAYEADVSEWQPVSSVSSGAIPLQSNAAATAEGYLFCLAPGDTVELFATFDATGENSISIAEVTSNSEPAARKVVFHNAGSGPQPLHANPAAKNRRYGVLGHWSEVNNTNAPRYFVLTGVHKLALSKQETNWRLSEMKILVESDFVVHIGWDDSGPARGSGKPYVKDNDYDDLSASLFFKDSSTRTARKSGGIQVYANAQPDLQIPLSTGEGFALTLEPGSAALLKATASASDTNVIAVVDTEDGRVLWASLEQGGRDMDMGAACLFNDSSSARVIRVVAFHELPIKERVSDRLYISKHQLLYGQPHFHILGFEDGKGDGDFNDVRASVLTVSDIWGSSR